MVLVAEPSPNVLVLDEVSNDLDLQTVEALEELLVQFSGLVLGARTGFV